MPAPFDLRLVAADMDGTLLDADKRVPDRLWPLLERLRERGIVFVPASGRQYATLRELFARAADGMPFIAENGTYVVRDGVEISSAPLAPAVVDAVLDRVERVRDAGADVGAVVCGKSRAYVSRDDAAFLDEVRHYYVAYEVVPDLHRVADEAIKIAIFDFGDAERDLAPALAEFAREQQVVVSGAHWVDVMAAGVDKGTALRALQRALGVTPAQTVAFGDYLNDLELLAAADHSYAVANAHPRVRAAARHQAPSNVDEGVIEVLTALLD